MRLSIGGRPSTLFSMLAQMFHNAGSYGLKSCGSHRWKESTLRIFWMTSSCLQVATHILPIEGSPQTCIGWHNWLTLWGLDEGLVHKCWRIPVSSNPARNIQTSRHPGALVRLLMLKKKDRDMIDLYLEISHAQNEMDNISIEAIIRENVPFLPTLPKGREWVACQSHNSHIRQQERGHNIWKFQKDNSCS